MFEDCIYNGMIDMLKKWPDATLTENLNMKGN